MYRFVIIFFKIEITEYAKKYTRAKVDKKETMERQWGTIARYGKIKN
jgi:hypothetical protein